MRKKPIPSAAQAKMIAHLWSSGDTARIGGYDNPTTLTCIKHGWLVPNGETGTFPNGAQFERHVLSETALDALEDFLREMRWKRTKANPSAS